MIEDGIRELARADNFAAVSTVLPSGHLQTQMMWVDCDDEAVLINTEVHRRKFKNVQLDPRITVLIPDKDNPYRYGEVRGRVTETIGGDRARRHIDELSQKYRGEPYDPSYIQTERVLLRIVPDRQFLYG